MPENLILVDARNRAIGREEKRAVHERGLRHRAFSIFLVDREGRLLLQRRHPAKYHSGGLWSNACCGHPRPGERTRSAAQRRLGEELGATATLHFGFLACYRTEFANGMIENEIVHVYFGLTPATLEFNPREVSSLARHTLAQLQGDIRRQPEKYSYWLRDYLAHHTPAIKRGVRDVVKRDGTA